MPAPAILSGGKLVDRATAIKHPYVVVSALPQSFANGPAGKPPRQRPDAISGTNLYVKGDFGLRGEETVEIGAETRNPASAIESSPDSPRFIIALLIYSLRPNKDENMPPCAHCKRHQLTQLSAKMRSFQPVARRSTVILRSLAAFSKPVPGRAADSAPPKPQFGGIGHKAAPILKGCKHPLPVREQIRCVFATCPAQRTPEDPSTVIGRCTWPAHSYCGDRRKQADAGILRLTGTGRSG